MHVISVCLLVMLLVDLERVGDGWVCVWVCLFVSIDRGRPNELGTGVFLFLCAYLSMKYDMDV